MPTAATITLGRDCSITVGGVALTGVRSVTVSMTRSEYELLPYNGGEAYCLPGHRTVTLEVETIASQDYSALLSAMGSVSTGVVVASTNVSATFVVTSLSASEPLDDVVVYSATLKRTVANA